MASSQPVRASRPRRQPTDVVRVSGWLQDKVDRLEGELARANREIDRLHSRPAPASDRENYIIGEMDFINRQLECKPFFYLKLLAFG